MSMITADPKSPSVLSRLTEVTEIRDAKGNIFIKYVHTAGGEPVSITAPNYIEVDKFEDIEYVKPLYDTVLLVHK